MEGEIQGNTDETLVRVMTIFFFLVSFLALFSKEKAPWRSARCHTGILGCSLQACVAAFPALLGGGPVSQGTS